MPFIKNEHQIAFSVLAEESGMKQVEIARRLHVTEATISRYLKGVQTPPPSKLDLLKRIVTDLKSVETVQGQNLAAIGAARELSKTLAENPELRQEIFETFLAHWLDAQSALSSAQENIKTATQSMALAAKVIQGPPKGKQAPSSVLPEDIGERVLRAEPSTKKKGDRHQHS